MYKHCYLTRIFTFCILVDYGIMRFFFAPQRFKAQKQKNFNSDKVDKEIEGTLSREGISTYEEYQKSLRGSSFKLLTKLLQRAIIVRLCFIKRIAQTEHGAITQRKKCSFLSVFSPNAGKYGPEKTPYLDTFQAVVLLIIMTIK